MYDHLLQLINVPIGVHIKGECISVAINQEVKGVRFIGRHCREQKLEGQVIEESKAVQLEVVLFTHCWCLRHV